MKLKKQLNAIECLKSGYYKIDSELGIVFCKKKSIDGFKWKKMKCNLLPK